MRAEVRGLVERYVADELDATYARGEVRGERGTTFPLFPTSVTSEVGTLLSDSVRAEGAVATIEIGMGLGLSTLHIVRGLTAARAEPGSHVAIDPYQELEYENAGLRLVEHAGVSNLVELEPTESLIALPRLIDGRRTFDFAFVDGSHHFDGVLLDLVCLARIVRPGGLIIVDDWWLEAVRLAVAYAVTNLGLLADTSRALRGGLGERIAILRTPSVARSRTWNDFRSFCECALPGRT